MEFKNLLEASAYFADSQRATDYLIKMRWSGTVTCVHCSHEKVYELKGVNKRFKCAKCRGQFSATKGTIFENSAIPLQKWFVAVYLHTSHKKGISSHQLAKDISVTQKSAWFMLSRIRFALQSGTFEHSPDGIIQVDETFIGGKLNNQHKSRYAKRVRFDEAKAAGKPLNRGRSFQDKKPVVGVLETGGNVIAKTVDNTRARTLTDIVIENIAPTATVVTDSYIGYKKLAQEGFNHKTVNHEMGQYVYEGFHTNGIENFWSHLKRGIYGIYHQVSDKHLDKYVDEFEFRFNTRKMGEAARFDKMLSLCNKRLTYPQLIQKEKE